MAKDLPQKKVQVKGKIIDRVYTLDAKKDKGNNELIIDTCHLNNYPCYVLFNCGSTHAFI